MCRRFAAGLVFMACVLLPTYIARADDVSQWPSEIEEELQKADARVLELQGEALTARLREDHEAVKRLEEEIRELDRKRVKLLRASGQL